MFWILQNSAGEVICPSNDESGFVVKKFCANRTVQECLTFKSEQDAIDWHDEHLIADDGEYINPKWKTFYAYEYINLHELV